MAAVYILGNDHLGASVYKARRSARELGVLSVLRVLKVLWLHGAVNEVST